MSTTASGRITCRKISTDLRTKWLGNWPPSGMTSLSATATSGPLAACLCLAPPPHRRHHRRPARCRSSGGSASHPRLRHGYYSSAATDCSEMAVSAGQESSPSFVLASVSRLPRVTDLDSHDLEDMWSAPSSPSPCDPPSAVQDGRLPVSTVLAGQLLTCLSNSSFCSGYSRPPPTRRNRCIHAHRHQSKPSPNHFLPSHHTHPTLPVSHVRLKTAAHTAMYIPRTVAPLIMYT